MLNFWRTTKYVSTVEELHRPRIAVRVCQCSRTFGLNEAKPGASASEEITLDMVMFRKSPQQSALRVVRFPCRDFFLTYPYCEIIARLGNASFPFGFIRAACKHRFHLRETQHFQGPARYSASTRQVSIVCCRTTRHLSKRATVKASTLRQGHTCYMHEQLDIASFAKS